MKIHLTGLWTLLLHHNNEIHIRLEFKEILRLLLGQFNGVERVIEIPSGSSAHVTPEHATLLLLRF